MLLAVALYVWAISTDLFTYLIPPGRYFWLGISYLSTVMVSTALLTFSLEYTGHRHWLIQRNITLLAIEPILTQIIYWTNPLTGLFFRGKWEDVVQSILTGTPWLWVHTDTAAGLVFVSVLTGGPWLWIDSLYNGILLVIAFIIGILFLFQGPHSKRGKFGVLLGAILIPILVAILNYFGWRPIDSVDLQMIAFSITSLVLLVLFLQQRSLDYTPIARNIVVENMNDGWMVIDEQYRIIDANPAAEKLINLPREQIFGKPVDKILSNWPKPEEDIGNNGIMMDTNGSVNVQNEWRYLNLRANPLKDVDGHLMGHTITWHDITDRRAAEEARQQARDEMFILLHSISSASSRALNLETFLEESIYQIVYSFQSQASIIFLMEETAQESGHRRLQLAAHHGLSPHSINKLGALTENNKIVEWLLENREPMLIPDIQTDARIPESMQKSESGCLLVAPMVIEDKILGFVSLLRREGPIYHTYEISRLSILADELAALIHGDRQRKLTIASTERRRLVRDLHDSITQNLYGLVNLTEAAQAGLKQGSAEILPRVLTRIGESARQALKEMRLFLFELQPIDLERDGLVSVLNQRLAAVEGRADVKARLLVDDDIYLLPTEQVALYFIAQEALNNVLRHAHARSVTIRLQQKKTNILLEIEDDGCGFDTQNGDTGGIGLRNMHERAAQIGGKLKIASSSGKGTKISVTMGKNRGSKPRQVEDKP